MCIRACYTIHVMSMQHVCSALGSAKLRTAELRTARMRDASSRLSGRGLRASPSAFIFSAMAWMICGSSCESQFSPKEAVASLLVVCSLRVSCAHRRHILTSLLVVCSPRVACAHRQRAAAESGLRLHPWWMARMVCDDALEPCHRRWTNHESHCHTQTI